MVAVVDGQRFRFSFTHKAVSTECRIERQAQVEGGWILEGHAFAFCHPTDNFCKETGRKVSLKRALNTSLFFAQRCKAPLGERVRNAQRRREMWNAYHRRGPKTMNRVINREKEVMA